MELSLKLPRQGSLACRYTIPQQPTFCCRVTGPPILLFLSKGKGMKWILPKKYRN